MKPSGIGGMAVIEGVMMKNKDEYAVAVRKPNNEIVIEKDTHKDFSDKVKLFKLPIFRGMLAFVDSMVIGIKVLNFSSSFFEEEEPVKENKKDKKKNSKINKDNDFIIEELSADSSVNNSSKELIDEKKSDKEDDSSNALLMALAVILSIVISISLFTLLPVFLTGFLHIKNQLLFALIEGIIRLVIFIGYIMLASCMPDIKRVFMYHGAEHKTINCLEHGCELTVENVKKHSKQHKRCGTSFMLFVMIISLVFFIFLPTGNLLWRVLSRLVLIPIIAGVSYEIIRLAGKSENKFVDILSKPGLLLQGLTTKEPDDTMIEVAICSVDAVFDWRDFLGTNDSQSKDSKNSKNNNKKNELSNKIIDDGKEKSANEVKKNNSNSNKNSKSKNNDQKNNGNNVQKGNFNKGHNNTSDPEVSTNETVKSAKIKASEEEDDEILKALDKYLDSDVKAVSGEGKN